MGDVLLAKTVITFGVCGQRSFDEMLTKVYNEKRSSSHRLCVETAHWPDEGIQTVRAAARATRRKVHFGKQLAGMSLEELDEAQSPKTRHATCQAYIDGTLYDEMVAAQDISQQFKQPRSSLLASLLEEA